MPMGLRGFESRKLGTGSSPISKKDMDEFPAFSVHSRSPIGIADSDDGALFWPGGIQSLAPPVGSDRRGPDCDRAPGLGCDTYTISCDADPDRRRTVQLFRGTDEPVDEPGAQSILPGRYDQLATDTVRQAASAKAWR